MKLPAIARIREEANVGAVPREAFYNAMLDEYRITDAEHRSKAMKALDEAAANIEILPGVLQTLPVRSITASLMKSIEARELFNPQPLWLFRSSNKTAGSSALSRIPLTRPPTRLLGSVQWDSTLNLM